MNKVERFQESAVQTAASSSNNGEVVNHCVMGVATVRLINAPQSAIDDLVRQFGDSWGDPSDNPDVEVSFISEFPRLPQLRFLGRNQAAYDAEHFYVLNSTGKMTRIDFNCIGGSCKLVCESGVESVPFLIPILAFCLLQRGYVLLHSSGFVYDGKGILVTGWQKGGKTEMLLPFMAAGAHYLSDEWTIVSSHDGTMRGLCSIVQVWSWHFKFVPQLWGRIAPSDRRRIQLVRLYQRLYRSLPKMMHKSLRPRRLFEELSAEGGNAFLGQARSSPQILFDNRIWDGPSNIDRIFLPTVGEGKTRVASISPWEVASRMVASLSFERRAFLVAYEQFRFAFPERANRTIESAQQEELRLLSKAFAGKPAYEVCHPYPVPLSELYEAALPFCR